MAKAKVVKEAASVVPEKKESSTKQVHSEIILKRISTQETVITLEGDTLLINRFHEKAKQIILDTQEAKAKELTKPKHKLRDKQESYELAKYLNREGKDSIPVLMVKQAVVSARKFAGLALTEEFLNGVFYIKCDQDGLIPLTYSKVEMEARGEGQPVQVGPWNAKKPDFRYRPLYSNWSVSLHISYRADLIKIDSLLALFENAGFSVGIGEWRPGRNGYHGTFKVRETPLRRVK